MENNNNKNLEGLLQKVINSLASAYISLGKSYPEYDAMSRSAFVDAISSRVAQRGQPSLPDDAIAFLTGLDTEYVSSGHAEPGDGSDATSVTSAAVRLIELWQAGAADSDGRANPLPYTGPLSFESLLGETGARLPVDDALAALVALGLVRAEGDMVFLNDDELPRPDDISNAEQLCAGAFPLLAAVGDSSRPVPAFVETHTLGRVPKRDAPRLMRIAESELKAAQARVADLMSAYEEVVDGTGVAEDADDDTTAITSGVYFVGRLSGA